MFVNILGVTYTIIISECDDGCDGYIDYVDKVITIDPETSIAFLGRVLRHEIIHAFLFESGLGSNASPVDCWTKNEEMIDWFAHHLPTMVQKMDEAYKEVHEEFLNNMEEDLCKVIM